MLTDLITGAEREVDVTIESTVAGQTILISLECRDRTRPASVGWVEEMQNKHSRLRTNKLILVSSSGFTAEAHRVARGYNIPLITPGPSQEEEVIQVLKDLSSLWVKRADITPKQIYLTATYVDDPKVTVPPGSILASTMTTTNGSFSIDPWVYVTAILDRDGLGEAMRDAVSGETLFTLTIERPEWREEDGSLSPFFVATENAGRDDQRAVVTSLSVTGDATISVAEVPLVGLNFGSTQYATGSGSSEKDDIILVVTNDGSIGKVTTRVFPKGSIKPSATTTAELR